MKLKKITGFLHLWLGLTSGLVVFIVALTGAIYVFSDDLMSLTAQHKRYVVPQQKELLPPSKLLPIGNNVLDSMYGKQPGKYWDWQSLTYYRASDRTVVLSGHRYKDPESYYEIFIDPYSGKVISAEDIAGTNFWNIVVDLHVNLMMGEFGSFLVHYGTLVFLLMVISGIVLWWPRNKNAAKQRFQFKWKENIRWKRKNYDLHNVLGFYACWVVIFMIITGLMWSFEWFDKAVKFALDGNTLTTEQRNYHFANKNDPEVMDLILQKAVSLDPKAFSYNLNFPGDSGSFEVYASETTNYVPANIYLFHPQNGELLSTQLYKNKTRGQKFRDLSGDVHYGWIFGWPSKIATFFACLIAASLPVTGFYIWWGRKKKRSLVPSFRNL